MVIPKEFLSGLPDLKPNEHKARFTLIPSDQKNEFEMQMLKDKIEKYTERLSELKEKSKVKEIMTQEKVTKKQLYKRLKLLEQENL